jgi:hypothetical protein
MRKDRENVSPSKLVAQSAVIATNSGSIVGLRLALPWSDCSYVGAGTKSLVRLHGHDPDPTAPRIPETARVRTRSRGSGP